MPKNNDTSKTTPRKPNSNTDAIVIKVPVCVCVVQGYIFRIIGRNYPFFAKSVTFDNNESGEGHYNGCNGKYHENNEWQRNRKNTGRHS